MFGARPGGKRFRAKPARAVFGGEVWANISTGKSPMTRQLTLAALAAVLFAGSANAQPMVIDKKVISAEAARKIADGCEAYAKERGWHVSVWVLDETLTPLYFYRMQGTPMFTVKPAMMKAEAAVRTGQPNDAYVENATRRGPFVATVNAIAQNYVLSPGGLPIMIDGQVAGGIGIGGSTDDRACAQAGIDAVFKKS
jgi:glc operon protein GlcG